MILGFSLFRRLDNIAGVNVYEVFPSASYQLLNGDKETRLCLSFNGFARGPKDMLDACVAAVTVYKYKKGKGCTVGGGDGLGTIVLPADLTDEQWQSPVHKWPR
jgi:predicted nuclease with RNAse H fold